ncbi:MAG: thioredoxin domain-containing protein [Blastocatellia bacterium]|nr:thioredoxin domain-containing protein [Blastocatellia bacterium]
MMRQTYNFLFQSVALVTVLCLSGFTVSAQEKVKPSTSDATAAKQAIEKIVREYLLKNPEVLREAMQALQAKEEKAKSELIAKNLKALKSEIYSDQDSPTIGNPHGDVSVVVFFDYNCGHCRNSLPNLASLTATDKSVRIVYKEFPIMSPNSEIVARAALAAKQQGKYLEFHQALLETDEVGEAAVKLISEKLNLNAEQLQKDMNDAKMAEALSRNAKLATSLEIAGTPAYIIGDQIIPGAIDTNSLSEMVAAERAKLPKPENVKVKPHAISKSSAGLK